MTNKALFTVIIVILLGVFAAFLVQNNSGKLNNQIIENVNGVTNEVTINQTDDNI